MDPKYLSINFKARYYTNGVLNNDTEYILLALHGYGQLGSFFIRHFEKLDNRIFTIVPEGLHRFYLNGMSGRVGASWMTKEDRLVDIENQFTYLDSLLKESGLELNANTQLIVLGFSQGVSTAIRWMSKSKYKPTFFISWAGSFPIDLNEMDNKSAFENVKMIQIIGNQDPYFNEEARKKLKSWISKNTTNAENFEFEGEHKIDSVFLQKIIFERIMHSKKL